MANALAFKIIDKTYTFEVDTVFGDETLSKPYRFTIALRCTTGNITDALLKRAVLEITIGTDTVKYCGIVTQFHHVEASQGRYYYKAVLEPKLALLAFNTRSDAYTDKAFYKKDNSDNILETVLATNNTLSKGLDFKIDALEANLPQYEPDTDKWNRWSFVCQYEETDLSFLSRLLEREGFYFYFEQNIKDQSGKNLEQERLVITDTNISLPAATRTLLLRPTSELSTGPTSNTYQNLMMKQFILPKTVLLTNYHYGQSGKGVLSVSKTVDSQGVGETHIYGENFYSADTGKDGEFLAGIRAQEILCRGKLYYGISSSVPLMPGMLINLAHTSDEFSGTYLVTQVHHEGKQPLPGADGSVPSGSAFTYSNSFTCISKDVLFRPDRATARPRITGTMNAFIAGDVDIPLDDKGRYKVELPFTGVKSGTTMSMKKSAWIRFAQPYAGADNKTYGMHFPLHKGAEVMLSFRDGDPDQPVISGAVFNSQNLNVVTDAHRDLHIIETPGGNKIEMNDQEGHKSFGFYCPGEGDGTWLHIEAEKDWTVKSKGNKHEVVCGQEDSIVLGSENYVTIGSKADVTIGNSSEFTLGTTMSTELGQSIEIKWGEKFEAGDTHNKIKNEETLLAHEKIELAGGSNPGTRAAFNGAWKGLALVLAALSAGVAAAGGDIAGAFYPKPAEGNDAAKQFGVSLVPIVVGIAGQVLVYKLLLKGLASSMDAAAGKMILDSTGATLHASVLATTGAQVTAGVAPASGSLKIAAATGDITIEKNLGGKITVDNNGVEIVKTAGGKVTTNDNGVKLEKGTTNIELSTNQIQMDVMGGGGAGFDNDTATMSVGNSSVTCTRQGITLQWMQGQEIKAGPISVNPAGMVMLG